jgi:hypothetical protein
MQTDFTQIFISKEEFNFFLTLNTQDRIDYLFGLFHSYEAGTNLDLSDFFKSVAASLEEKQDLDIEDEFIELTDKRDSNSKLHQVAVMIDEENIMIEANSLRAIRVVMNNFMQSGYILQRDKQTEKMFSKDKVTKYIRVFNIIDQITGICFN